MGEEDFTYQGSELSLFAEACNWKTYFATFLRPYVGRRVLEVGAGLGSNVGLLIAPLVRKWVCLEPDASLADQIREKIAQRRLPDVCQVRVGTIAAITATELFETIFYIDVLEHVEDDQSELRCAARHLADDGFLVVLAPAHQALFGAFDVAIGHFRRYSARHLGALAPPGLRLVNCRMLDSCGLMASVAHRLVARESAPSRSQITFWDHCLVRLSRLIDPLTLYSFGKTIVMIWQKYQLGSSSPSHSLQNDP